MLSRREYQSIEAPEALLHKASKSPEVDDSAADVPATNTASRFSGQFADCMEMYADVQTVAEYINAHQGWFCRCAHPMKVEPLEKNSYTLVIGRFGSFGYEVEPKVGLELLPPDKGVYLINSIPLPNYADQGYEVNFRSVMELVEAPRDSSNQSSHAPNEFSTQITRVEWQLDLAVYVQFPKFIQRLPKSMIQSTGNQLLQQIVRQVSRRLTYKVQEDFHNSLGIPFPVKSGGRRALGSRE